MSCYKVSLGLVSGRLRAGIRQPSGWYELGPGLEGGSLLLPLLGKEVIVMHFSVGQYTSPKGGSCESDSCAGHTCP